VVELWIENIHRGKAMEIEKKVLQSVLKRVKPSIPNKPQHPTLGCVHLLKEEDSLTLKGYNLQLGVEISTHLDKELIEEKLDLAVPHALLTRAIASFPDDAINLYHEQGSENEFSLEINDSWIRGMNPDELPKIPNLVDNSPIFEGNFSRWAALFGAIGYAASTDPIKDVLQGIYLEGGSKVEAAATDGHRLAIFRDWDLLGEAGAELILPSCLVYSFHVTMNNEEEENIGIRSEGQNVEISGESGRVFATTYERQYPAYKQLLPDSFTHEVVLDVEQSQAVINFVATFSKKKNGVVQIHFQGDKALVTAEGEGGKGEYFLEIQSPDDTPSDLKIAFNASYLQDALKAFEKMEESQVVLKINDPTSPAVLGLTSGMDRDWDMEHLIMPVALDADKL
jgi:DNA polymerase-3 subunit beta